MRTATLQQLRTIATVLRRTVYTILVVAFLCIEAPVLGLVIACFGSLFHIVDPAQGSAIIDAGCAFARATTGYAAGCGAQ